MYLLVRKVKSKTNLGKTPIRWEVRQLKNGKKVIDVKEVYEKDYYIYRFYGRKSYRENGKVKTSEVLITTLNQRNAIDWYNRDYVLNYEEPLSSITEQLKYFLGATEEDISSLNDEAYKRYDEIVNDTIRDYKENEELLYQKYMEVVEEVEQHNKSIPMTERQRIKKEISSKSMERALDNMFGR